MNIQSSTIRETETALADIERILAALEDIGPMHTEPNLEAIAKTVDEVRTLTRDLDVAVRGTFRTPGILGRLDRIEQRHKAMIWAIGTLGGSVIVSALAAGFSWLKHPQ